MKKILFYYQANKWSNSLITMLTLLKDKGYDIKVLTICKKGLLHEALEKKGIQCFTYDIPKKNSIIFYSKHIYFLVKFSKQHKIDYIHSHIQQTNFIACIANLFTKSKLLVFRHHYQSIRQLPYKIKKNKNEILFDRIINFLAPKIIVPSQGVYDNILNHEKIKKQKLHIIPYIYDFKLYKSPNLEEVKKIKEKYPCTLRLIMVSRLIKLKQHHIVFPVIKKLVNRNFNIKLLVLSEGPEKENLENWIIENNMSNFIFMLGFKDDFINYMAASDMLIQPSLTDASNSVAKEMALLEKIIAVTKNVGDYSEYVQDEYNGFLISQEKTEEDLEQIITKVYYNKDEYKVYGKRLKQEVLKRFDKHNSEHIIQKYITLMNHENL